MQKKKIIIECIIPINNWKKNLGIVNTGFFLFSAYKKGSIWSTIFPSWMLISKSNKALMPNGKEVNNKLKQDMNQSSKIVCPVKLQ